jgi:hypothetical protein
MQVSGHDGGRAVRRPGDDYRAPQARLIPRTFPVLDNVTVIITLGSEAVFAQKRYVDPSRS